MSFNIKDENGRNVEVITGLQDHLSNFYDDNAIHFSASGDFGDAVFQCYGGDGFTIWYSSYVVSRAAVLNGTSDQFALELHISMNNQIQGTWDGVDQPSLPPYRFNLSFSPHVSTSAVFQSGKKYETCDIHFTVPFLSGFAADFPLLDIFMEKVSKDTACNLVQEHYYCTPEMVRNIRFIRDLQTNKRQRILLLECKVKEILIDALEKVETSESEPRPLRLTPTDIERLHYARLLISTAEDHMPTYKELCKKALLNEFKLKKGFRLLFNITPYQFYVQVKMEKAKLMLTSTDLPVADIAHMLPYQYDYNFSIEFKRYTGWTPLQYRKQFRNY